MGVVAPIVHALTAGDWIDWNKKGKLLNSITLFYNVIYVFYTLVLLKLTPKSPTWQVMSQVRKSRELTVDLYSCGSYDLI